MVIMLAFVVSSCVFFDLEKQNSPNAVTPENAGLDFLYNNIQLDFNGFNRNTLGSTGTLSRQLVLFAPLYDASFQPTAFNGIWSNAYAGLLPDMVAMEELASQQGLESYIANSKVMRAYVLTTLVDLFGDVPLLEATQGTDFISPNSTPGADVYTAAETLLDEALAIYNDPNTLTFPTLDIYFDGNKDDWIALANTLKLRLYLNTRLVDAQAGTKIANIVNNELITGRDGADFEFEYGTSRSNPNNRHPWYNNMYENNDGAYMNNWFMYMCLQESKADVNWNTNSVVLPSNGDVSRTEDDPRVRWYFYRKDGDLTDQSDTEWSCYITDLPDDATPQQLAHLTAVDPNMPYCYARVDGYFGRSHGNNEGIPPDGPIRSAYGMYPAGGNFDDNSFDDTQNLGIDGALGQGINPIMLGTWVEFMRAEAALVAGTGEDDRALLESAMRESFAKVYSFVGKVDLDKVVAQDVNGNDITLEDAYLANWDNDVDDYVDDVLAVYDAANADGKLEIIMEEYMISLWGNGLEAYNALRRTSKPSRIQPNVQTGPGTFVWSMIYPSDHVDRNQNVTQKPDFTEKIFWDTTPQDAVK